MSAGLAHKGTDDLLGRLAGNSFDPRKELGQKRPKDILSSQVVHSSGREDRRGSVSGKWPVVETRVLQRHF